MLARAHLREVGAQAAVMVGRCTLKLETSQPRNLPTLMQRTRRAARGRANQRLRH
jgi:hypothetical protein